MDELLRLLAVPTHTGHTEQMYEYLRLLGIEKGWTMFSDKKWNLYAVKGEGTSKTYPCAVAHMDTVHYIKKDGKITPLTFNGNIIGFDQDALDWTGIGGDDKCGIWAAIHCLTVLPACKAVFFVDEERGCVGSGNCDMDFFKDCRYILQADRRGNQDFVTDINGPLSSKEFLAAVAPVIKEFGYKHSDGLMTDVKELRDNDVGISVANMSAGYYRPHSDREFINVFDLDNVCKLMQAIFERVTDTFPFKYERKVWTPSVSKGGWTLAHKPSNNDHEGYMGLVRCDYCGSLTLATELIEGSDGTGPFVCLDCALVKEDTGVYPVTNTTKGFWQRLAGKGASKRERRKMKKRFKGYNGGGDNGIVKVDGNGATTIIHGTTPGVVASLKAAADESAEQKKLPF